MASPVWLITGASSGFGLYLSLHVLSKGYRVIGSVRSRDGASASAISQIESAGGSIILIDMNSGPAAISSAAASALTIHGRLDVLVNNAGYGLVGAVEDISDEESHQQLETNFFGPLALTRAVLPTLRAQKSGVIVQVSSVAGLSPLPSCALYSASKYALEGFSEGLAKEVSPFGIKVMIVEPGAFKTSFQSSIKYAGTGEIGEAYKGGPVEDIVDKLRDMVGKQAGDPEKAVKVLMDQIMSLAEEERSDAKRLLLGSDAVGRMRSSIEVRQRDLAACEQAAKSTDFASV